MDLVLFRLIDSEGIVLEAKTRKNSPSEHRPMKRKPSAPFGASSSLKPRFIGSNLTDSNLCEHNWAEREVWHQVLKSEGKTIWKCPKCGSITNTYAWHKPE